MSQLYGLDEIDVLPLHWVGERALQLGRLRQQGYAVVPTVIVPAPWLLAFLETIPWSEPILANLPDSRLRVDMANAEQLAAIAQQLQWSLLNTSLPGDWLTMLTAAIAPLQAETLILRPSLSVAATVAPAAVAPLLGVQVCPAEPAAMATALKQVWASLFAASSLFCWQQLGLELPRLHLAVLIQPLWPAIAAGTIQFQTAQTLVEASWGLRLAQQWGMADPESYSLPLTADPPIQIQAGYQELAYQVQSVLALPAGATAWQGDCVPQLARPGIQAYLLSEAVRQRSVLTPADWLTLRRLVQTLRTSLSPTGWAATQALDGFQVEWHLYQRADTAPQLYLTDVVIDPTSATLPPAQAVTSASTRATVQEAVSLTVASTPLTRLAAIACRDVPPLLRGVGAAMGQVVAPAYVATQLPDDPTQLPADHILITTAVLPSWIGYLRHCRGVIAEQGGMNSHGAIVARELGIPAIVGAPAATQQIQTGDWLWLDGQGGWVYRIPTRYYPQLLAYAALPNASGEALGKSELALVDHRDELASATSGASLDLAGGVPPEQVLTTRLMVNLSQPSSLSQLSGLPIAGVGLLRSELMMIEALEQQHPQCWLQQGRQRDLIERLSHTIAIFAQAVYPQPVMYRSLDLRSHEFAALQGAPSQPPEANPMLGLRGAAAYWFDPTLFEVELAALAAVQQAGYRNLHLLLPFVRTVEEFQFCRERVGQSDLDRDALQLWLMAEVPSVLLLLPDYVAAGVQGVSIGTNDLTQLLLGIDRDHPQLSTYLDDRHPAVLRAIAQLIEQSHQLGIPCSICGQAPSRDLGMVEQLVRWGIDSISVEVEAVRATYRAIVEAEQRMALDAAHHQLDNLG